MMTVVEIPAFQTTASISDCFKLPPSLFVVVGLARGGLYLGCVFGWRRALSAKVHRQILLSPGPVSP